MRIYENASRHTAVKKGLILADTKFEFGLAGRDTIILADEVPDPPTLPRYWPAATCNPGGPAATSFDKQYVRDYLESIRWNKRAPAPSLPEEVVSLRRARSILKPSA